MVQISHFPHFVHRFKQMSKLIRHQRAEIRPNDRRGISTVETAMIVALVVGVLILTVGSIGGNISTLFEPVDDVLQRQTAHLDTQNSTGQRTLVKHRNVLDEEELEEPTSNLLVGLGIPAAILAAAGGAAYLVVKV